jgi:hypothetical protein
LGLAFGFVCGGERVNTPLEEFFERVGTNWSFDPLHDPNWQPSREDYLALRNAALAEVVRLREERDRLAAKLDAFAAFVSDARPLLGLAISHSLGARADDLLVSLPVREDAE